MGSSGGTSEIVESTEELDSMHQCNGFDRCFKSKAGERDGKSHAYQLDDDLSRIIEAIDLRISSRVSSPSRQMGVHMAQKSTMKKPVQGSAIGISESVTLKQALRRLCISQASEMAATKRPSKSMNVNGASEAGAIRKLYASVVVQASELVLPIDGEKGSLVEVSVVPEKCSVSSCKKASESSQVHDAKPSDTNSISSPKKVVTATGSTMKTRIKDIIAPGSTDDGDYGTAAEEIRKEGKGNSKNLESVSKSCAKTIKTSASPRLIRPAFRKDTHIKRKGKQDIAPASRTSNKSCEIKKAGTVPTKVQLGSTKKPATPALSSAKSEVNGNDNDIGSTKPHSTPNSSSAGKVVDEKKNESLRPGEKGECSQSSKSSIGDYSSSTSISEDSHNSGYYANGSRPHMSKDVRWVAIRHVAMHHGSLGLKNFKLIKKLGCGDIGTVYLADLTGSGCFFALKVMDIDFLVSRKKMLRAQTEREILQMLDHPFLPTLYAHFTTDNLSCLVMEYCPGGDLHVLRQKQPSRCFTEPEARFYVAEVLLALEYLHMLGVIYRDLKPENILVREDGHIMLSDFDLSLRCKATPTLLRSSSLGSQESVKKLSGPCLESSCMKPLCTQPDWAPVSCFTPRLVSSTASNSRKPSSDLAGQVSLFPQLVVEPTDARSNSFVGTHEYLAPEIIRGDGHGSSVDWWTLGIFLYELLFGRTPFKGPGHEETLTNVVSYGLSFPESPAVSFHARDLIRGLLVKEPENRLGSVRGAAEIKTHPFFEGLNWALIRCASPPEIPSSYATGNPLVLRKKKEGKCLDFRTNGEDVEFDLF